MSAGQGISGTARNRATAQELDTLKAIALAWPKGAPPVESMLLGANCADAYATFKAEDVNLEQLIALLEPMSLARVPGPSDTVKPVARVSKSEKGKAQEVLAVMHKNAAGREKVMWWSMLPNGKSVQVAVEGVKLDTFKQLFRDLPHWLEPRTCKTTTTTCVRYGHGH